MSFAEHEVGSVPSSTNPVTPTQPVAHKVWAIVGIIALSLTFWPIGLALGITLLFVSERRYRTVGIVGTAVSAVAMAITGMFYFLLLNVVPMALNSVSVAPVAPAATGSESSSSPQGTGDTSVRVAAAKAILADPTTFMETQYAIVDRAYCERDPGLLDQVYTADSSYLPAMKAAVLTSGCIKTQVLSTEPWPDPTDPATQEIGFYATLSTFNNGEKFSVDLFWDGVQWKTKNG